MTRRLPFFLLSLLAWLPLPARSALLVHSNDVLGELEPCGCRSNPTGGLSRRMNWMAGFKDPERLQVDAGDLLFQSEALPGLLREQARVQAEWLLKALDLTGPTVLLPGEKDFALGLEAYARLLKKSQATVVVSNAPAPPGTGWKKRYVWKTKDENNKPLRIAILGVLSPKLRWPKGIRGITAPAKALPPLLRALKGRADIIVVLSHQGLDEDRALAAQVPGIQLIVGAHTQSFLQEPAKAGSAWVVQASFRNQHVGAWKIRSAALEPTDYELKALDPAFDSPAGRPNAVDPLVISFKEAIARLNAAQIQKQEAAASSETGHSTQLQTFPRCAECHLKQFEFWRGTNHARALQALVTQKQSMNKECLSCHTVGLGRPEGWDTLAQMGKLKAGGEPSPRAEFEQAAIESYLLRLTQASGPEDPLKLLDSDSEPQPVTQTLARIEKLHAPVQCENCHGAGGDHPFMGKVTRRPELRTCLSCHTIDRAPGWYKDGKVNEGLALEKMKSVSCPVGGTP